MKVLVDYIGHADLYYSMHALFAKRLGWELYRPNDDKGWQDAGIWTSAATPDIVATQPLQELNSAYFSIHRYYQNFMSFQEFMDTDIDIVVTTVYLNEKPFDNLVKLHKSKPLYIRQIANIREKPKECNNILLSTLEPMPKYVNWIEYLPEHLDDYHPGELIFNNKIKSFSNFLALHPVDLQTWRQFQSKMQDYSFWMHGSENEHGSIPQYQLPDAMRDAMFIWHTKAHGGCGYTARQALACGKPLIVKKRYTKLYYTLAHKYLVDGINCIDLSIRSDDEGIKRIKELSNPDAYAEICASVIEHNKTFMNFEEEAKQIKKWIENLL